MKYFYKSKTDLFDEQLLTLYNKPLDKNSDISVLLVIIYVMLSINKVKLKSALSSCKILAKWCTELRCARKFHNKADLATFCYLGATLGLYITIMGSLKPENC